jgi:uncharacterized tellurite resistance protein B-like protein
MENSATITSYQHFLAYLFICIAKADYKLVDEEVEAVIIKIQRDSSEEEAHQIFKNVLNLYKKQSDREILDTIEHYSDKFAEEVHKSKAEIYEDLQHIMEADGTIRDVETLTLRIIKKILNG